MSFNLGSEQLKEEERGKLPAIADAAARAEGWVLPAR
jgi:hypothetical protein